MIMRRCIGCILSILALGVSMLSLLNRTTGLRMDFQASVAENELSLPSLPQGIVSVNLADMDDLLQLPGVGETLAQEILTERESNGRFYYPEDLLSVRGIGPVKLEAIRPWINFDD